MRLITARYALVSWPKSPHDAPCCITLDAVADAVTRGAVLIGREDAILEERISAFNPPHVANADPGGD